MRSHRFVWIAVGLVLALYELTLLRTTANREFTWAYPAIWDQSFYLYRSYYLHDTLLSQGFRRFIDEAFVPLPQGFLMPVQATAAFLIGGASRLTALSTNFVYFIALQGIWVGVLKHCFRSWSVALTGLGLLLCLASPYSEAGGLFDFRIDFLTFCLFGIFACLVVRSHVFQDRGWSLAAGVVAAVLVLFRFITITYITGIVIALLAYFSLVLWRARNQRTSTHETLGRLTNIGLGMALVLLITLPFLWIARSAIHDYYVVGHFSGDEKHLRAADFGIRGFWGHLGYYPTSVLTAHIGRKAVAVYTATLTFLGALFFSASRTKTQHTSGDHSVVFLALCAIVPFTVLTLDESKSPVVGGVLVPPITLAAVLLMPAVIRSERSWLFGLTARSVLRAVAVAVLCAGLGIQASFVARRGTLAAHLRDVLGVNQMYEDIGEYCERIGWNAPRISADVLAEYFVAYAFSDLYYERHGVLLRAEQRLPNSLFAITESAALAALKDSDVVILAQRRNVDTEVPYPFSQAAKAVEPALNRFANEHLFLFKTYQFWNRDVSVYMRPTFDIQGDVGGWLSNEGITLVVPAAVAAKAKAVVIKGVSNFSFLPKPLTVSGSWLSVAVPVTTDIKGNEYGIAVTLPDTPAKSEDLSIKLRFSTYFVPKDLHINDDTRQLVISTPSERIVVLKDKQ